MAQAIASKGEDGSRASKVAENIKGRVAEVTEGSTSLLKGVWCQEADKDDNSLPRPSTINRRSNMNGWIALEEEVKRLRAENERQADRILESRAENDLINSLNAEVME